MKNNTTRILAEKELAVNGMHRTVLREQLKWNTYEKAYDYDAIIVVVQPMGESFRIGVGKMRPTWARLEFGKRFSAKRLAEITVPDQLRHVATENALANERD